MDRKAPVYSPSWWESRNRILEAIAKQTKARDVRFTDEQKRDGKLALDLATYSGNDADPAYIAARAAWEAAGIKPPSKMADEDYPF